MEQENIEKLFIKYESEEFTIVIDEEAGEDDDDLLEEIKETNEEENEPHQQFECHIVDLSSLFHNFDKKSAEVSQLDAANNVKAEPIEEKFVAATPAKKIYPAYVPTWMKRIKGSLKVCQQMRSRGASSSSWGEKPRKRLGRPPKQFTQIKRQGNRFPKEIQDLSVNHSHQTRSRRSTSSSNITETSKLPKSCQIEGFTCDFCGSALQSKYSLQRHILSKHILNTQVSANVEEILIKVEPEDEKKLHKEGNHICVHCGRALSNPDSLKRHISTIHLSQKFICDVCGVEHSTKSLLQRHLSRHRQEKTKHICVHCGRTLSNRENLKRHISTLHMTRKFICDFCGFARSTKSSLKRHLSAHQQKNKTKRLRVHLKAHEKPKHICVHCGRTLSNPDSLKRHILAIHLSQKFICDVCGVERSTKSLLKRHLSTHHQKEKTKHICECCGQELANRANLKRHILTIHMAPKFICDVCGVERSTKSLLQGHLSAYHQNKKTKKVHLKTHEKPKYICERCGQELANQNSFRRHMRNIHLSQKYACDVCGLKYSSKRFMMDHFGKIHGFVIKRSSFIKRSSLTKRQIEDFICFHCKKSFPTKSELLKHAPAHASEKLPRWEYPAEYDDDVKKIYLCDLCPWRFNDLKGLREHIAYLHSDARPYPCNFPSCNRTYKTKAAMIDHHRSVHIEDHERPHACPKCPKKFKIIHQLKEHILRVHEKPKERNFCCSLCDKKFYIHLDLKVHEKRSHLKF